jgi:hypothetical protein
MAALKDHWPQPIRVTNVNTTLFKANLLNLFPEMYNNVIMQWGIIEMTLKNTLRPLEFTPVSCNHSHHYMTWLLAKLYPEDNSVDHIIRTIEEPGGLLSFIESQFRGDNYRYVMNECFIDCEHKAVLYFSANERPRQFPREVYMAGFFMYMCSLNEDQRVAMLQNHGKRLFTRDFIDEFRQSPLCQSIWRCMSRLRDATITLALQTILLYFFAGTELVYNTFITSISGADFFEQFTERFMWINNTHIVPNTFVAIHDQRIYTYGNIHYTNMKSITNVDELLHDADLRKMIQLSPGNSYKGAKIP